MAKRIVVTGASSGIGRAVADRLLKDGDEVIGLSRSAPNFTDARFRHVPADLADVDAIALLARELGPVDGLVHAAGFMKTARVGELDLASGEAMWRLHVAAAAALADALVPSLPTGGRIVLIGSRVSAGAAGRSQYAAAKAAMVAMARSWAIELAPRGHHGERGLAGRHRNADVARSAAQFQRARHAAHRPVCEDGGSRLAGRLPAR